MIVDVKVPILAESVAEATLMTWHKQVGDAVQRGDNLIEIETDKVTLEVTAPESGVIKEIVKLDGAEVKSDEVIARIDTDHAESGTGVHASTASVARPVLTPEAQPSRTEATPKLSPAVRKLLNEHQLDPATIPTQRADGRITKEDVMNYLSRPQPAPTEARGPERGRPAAPMPAGARPEQRVPMTRLRRRAAERLLAAQRENAILTTFNEVNMQPVMDLRARYREEFEKTHGVKLGFMSFFTKAAVEALKRFPVVNASVDGTDIVYHGYFDIGIAVGSPRGLVVPILRDADLLSFAEIEKHIRDFSERARDGKLTIEELTGGTFTITNGGIFGSLISTPILNPPQSAILGMHKIQERPVAENGQVVIRSMMYLALSYDHRIIDGREAVQFLVCIKEQIEDPARLLLQI